MGKPHVVQQGESLASIAHDHGFHDWHTLYEAAENADLRRRRPNPNVLHPGDVVHVPDKAVRHEAASTGANHRYVVKRTKWKLRLVLTDARSQALEDVPFVLALDGAPAVAGRTGPGGLVECAVPARVRRGELRVLGRIYPVALGALDPITRISGVQARLANLGFDPGPVDGVYGHRTAHAIYGFQRSQGLHATGSADDATRKRMLFVHDGDERCLPPEELMVAGQEEPAPAAPPPGELLAPLAAEDSREIVIVGAQDDVADGDIQKQDDASMDFYKAALSLTPDASNAGETILYVERSGYSRAMRDWIEANHGPYTQVFFFGTVEDLASQLTAWPRQSVGRLTIVAHGYPDHVSLKKGHLLEVGESSRAGAVLPAFVTRQASLEPAFFASIAALFRPDALIVSHACRTADGPLAQQFASAAGVPVQAWTGRTSYAHRNADGTLTKIFPSRPEPPDALVPSNVSVASLKRVWNASWDDFKEWRARHWTSPWEESADARFVQFQPGGQP